MANLNTENTAEVRRQLGRRLVELRRPRARSAPPAPGLARAELTGRLVELSGRGNSATLTLACQAILDAQREGETAAWIGRAGSGFYPPDMAAGGVDLAALPVVRCPDAKAVARAADRLARSGAFGLLVLDLGDGDAPTPWQSRLAGLALKYDIAILLLTEKSAEAPSLGSLVSLRGQSERRRLPDGRFLCRFQALKDKQQGPGWGREAAFDGPPGLR